MDELHAGLLGRARGLAEIGAIVEREIAALVAEAAAAGVNRRALADAVGIDRATLYRRYLSEYRRYEGSPETSGQSAAGP